MGAPHWHGLVGRKYLEMHKPTLVMYISFHFQEPISEKYALPPHQSRA
jgi:hypothetical protein